MCLLITQSSTSPVINDKWLADFYDYNSDGVGVMYSENDSLVIEKILPKNEKAFIDFYQIFNSKIILSSKYFKIMVT